MQTVSIKGFADINHLKRLQLQGLSIIVYIDLSGKEPHRQVGMDRVIVSGPLDSIMISTLTLGW